MHPRRRANCGRRPRAVRALVAALAWTALAGGLARAAAPPIKVEAIRIGLGVVRGLPNQGTAGQAYKVGTWTPVRVQLKAGPAAFSGFMAVAVPDDDGNATVVRRPVSLGAGATEWLTAYVRPGSTDAEVTVQLTDSDGYRVGPPAVSTSLLQGQETGVRSYRSDQLLLATAGHPAGVDAVPALGGFLSTGGAVQDEPIVVVARIEPGDLPGRPLGYDAVEAVLIDTNDKDVMAALDAGRGEALRAWVQGGGHLVVAVGANWQQVNDSVLQPMLPALPRGRMQLDDLGTVESFAGSNLGADKRITKSGQAATVTRLEVLEDRGGKALDSTAAPLVVRGPYGFGRVTVVGLDVDQRPFATWDDRGLFWLKAFDLRRQTDEAAGPGAPPSQSLYQANANDLATLLHKALEQFPGVKLVPFGWVAFFIFLYILLIGPGDYFFLKKVVKRMELTWVTFPLIVLSVSLVAYYAAYVLKGTELRINKVDVLDLDEPNHLARGSTWLTIFSPQNRDYDLAIVPQGLGAGAQTSPIARGPARIPAGTELALSWFGMPENTFGGMNNPSRLTLSSSSYAYGPLGSDQAPDRPEALRGVRIPIWSTRSFTGRWLAPGTTAVEATLEAVGTDRLAGTVTNRLDRPLRNPIIVFGKQVYYDLGTLEPGATVQVELKNNRTLAGYLEVQARNFPVQSWSMETAEISRPDLARVLMFRDAAASRGGTPASNPLRYLDLSGQLALDRPMLVAEVDTPAALVDLGRSGSRPKVSQTTLLRVILPLGKPQAGPEAGEPAADKP